MAASTGISSFVNGQDNYDLPPEGDIYDDLSDDCNEDEEEIVEVEINADDIDEFVQELKRVKGLDTEITCAAEDEEEEEEPDLMLMEEHMDLHVSEDDHFYDDFLIPITEMKDEVPADPAEDPTALIKDSLLKLHKLDSFLVDKFVKADKNFLRKRFLSQIMFKQEKVEQSGDMIEPLPLPDGTFMCHLCFNLYNSKKAVNRHVREVHQRGKLSKCDQCDYVGASAGALTYHVQSVHLKMYRYECPRCEKFKTQKRMYLIKHLNDEHDISEDEADTIIQSKLRLKNRAIGAKHHCFYCDYSSDHKFTVKKHMKRRHADQVNVDPEVVCQHCLEEFIDKESKARHPCPIRLKASEAVEGIQIDNDGRYHCPLCSKHCKKYLDVEELTFHYMEIHVDKSKKIGRNRLVVMNPDPKNVNSKDNDRDLSLLSSNLMHDSMTDAGDGSFLCDQCPFIGSKEDLTWHVRQIHPPEKAHKCDHCDFSSNSKDVLTNHIKRVHDGIASRMCNFCSSAYRNLKELGEHMRETHFEKAKHLFCTQPSVSFTILHAHCAQCCNGFNIIFQCEFWSRQRNKLDTHIRRVHLRQKNFLCDKCEFRAFIQPELDAHIREVREFINKILKGVFKKKRRDRIEQ